MVERRDVKCVLPGKPHGGGKTFGRVAVVTEDKSSVNANAMPPQIGQRLFKPAPHGVEHLVHVLEIVRIQTLESNKHALAAAAREQFEELRVVRGVNA